MRFVFWIFFVPSQNCIQVVLSNSIVIVRAVFWMVFIVTVGKANTSWLLNVKHVRELVPGVIVFVKLGLGVCLEEWTVFLSPCQHGGATWTTIVPDHQWVVLWIVLTGQEHVVNSLRCFFDWNISRVHLKIDNIWVSWDGVNLFSCWCSVCNTNSSQEGEVVNLKLHF